ncbi:MAG: hypothetical protein ACUVQH_14845, partial [Thermogutta sp.]
GRKCGFRQRKQTPSFDPVKQLCKYRLLTGEPLQRRKLTKADHGKEMAVPRRRKHRALATPGES